MSVGISELVTVCASMERRNDALFAALGAWLRGDEPPTGAVGRLVTEACHRHAEHARLWRERLPSIPVAGDGVATREVGVLDADGYRVELADVRTEVEALAGRVDDELDPSTRRVVEIVQRDLDALAARL